MVSRRGERQVVAEQLLLQPHAAPTPSAAPGPTRVSLSGSVAIRAESPTADTRGAAVCPNSSTSISPAGGTRAKLRGQVLAVGSAPGGRRRRGPARCRRRSAPSHHRQRLSRTAMPRCAVSSATGRQVCGPVCRARRRRRIGPARTPRAWLPPLAQHGQGLVDRLVAVADRAQHQPPRRSTGPHTS